MPETQTIDKSAKNGTSVTGEPDKKLPDVMPVYRTHGRTGIEDLLEACQEFLGRLDRRQGED